MKFENTLAAFQNSLGSMASAQGRVQNGFSRALDREHSPTKEESNDFVSAFVEEDFAAKLAQAQLKVLKSQDENLETLLEIKKDS